MMRMQYLGSPHCPELVPHLVLGSLPAMASLNSIAEAAFLDTIFSDIFAQCILLIARSNHPVLLFTEMQFPTLDLIGLDHVDEEEEADLMRPFLAVVERQGLCEFQVKHSPDGTPFLCAIPSAEIAAQVDCHHSDPKLSSSMCFSEPSGRNEFELRLRSQYQKYSRGFQSARVHFSFLFA